MTFTPWKSWLVCPRPLTLALGTLAALYFLHFGVAVFWLGPFDFNHLSAYYELAWRFWTESPGAPHFNPFFCGGRTLGGDPQIPIFSPIVLGVGILGPLWTLKWEMLAQLMVGCYALWKWLERWKADEAARAWAVILFAGGGFIVARFMVGHVTLGFYSLMPAYFLLSYRLADPRESTKTLSAVWLVFLCAYCCLYKPNFLIYAVPPLLVEAGVRSALQKSSRPLLILFCAVALGACVAAVSWLPAAQYFHAFPRVHDVAAKTVPLSAFFASLLLPLKAIPAAWYGPDFMQRHEYSIFLGPVALYFAAQGFRFFSLYKEEKIALLVFAAFSIAIGLGASNTLASPYTWLQMFWPGFQSVRVPVRFWYGAYLCLIVFSALGFRWPKSWVGQCAVVLFGLLPLVGHSAINLSKVSFLAASAEQTPPRSYVSPIEQEHALPDEPYSAIRRGKAVIECVENVENFPSPRLRPGPLLDYQTSASSVSAHWVGWSQVRVEGQSAYAHAPISFNLNHHPFWKWQGEGARIVSGKHDLLTLEVDPSFRGTLVYSQPGLREGIGLSLLGLLLLTGFAIWSWRQSRRPWRIGLTGGVASGKTTVGKMLRDTGWWVVDLDAEARVLTDTDPVIQNRLRALFGESIFENPAKLDRQKLREAVFAQPEKRAALERLLHPRLMEIFEKRFQQAKAAKAVAVVCEAALLVETGHYKKLDKLVVVIAPQPVRRARLQTRDGSSGAVADAVFAAQSSDSDKIAKADFILTNTGDLNALAKQVTEMVAAVSK